MLMMLASWLDKSPQSLGQFVLQASGASGAVWRERYPADAHDAGSSNRPNHSGSLFCKRPGLRGPCGENGTQLMLMMLASWLVSPNHSGSLFCKRPGLRGPCGENGTQLMLMMLASWLVKSPQSLGQFVLQAGLRGPCGENGTQLMLMMIVCWLVKSPQSLGQVVLQASGASGAVWRGRYPADAHDARFLACQITPITRAVCFASVRGFGGCVARTVPS